MTVVEELRAEVAQMHEEIARLRAERDERIAVLREAIAMLREAPSHKAMPADQRYWAWSNKRIRFLDALTPQPEPAA